ncbi:LysM peptidoglycan-binding domain-containing protein [Pseudaestuariivita rosea]|uniref:LysM peptidoglycan-binding domain-containing protein n=1 Tax=Pseudaestuariivita rosea TaxID=2763263 RepID=UPI001ABB06FC|nr:LysM domain-containing protein [Pseudaestuariivita rosea]
MINKRLAMAAAFWTAGAFIASAQEACSVYTVQPGDTLNIIATAAYDDLSFRALWNANRDIIGPDPNVLEVGMQLRLPCEDGSLPLFTRTSPSAQQAQQPVATEPPAGTPQPVIIFEPN